MPCDTSVALWGRQLENITPSRLVADGRENLFVTAYLNRRGAIGELDVEPSGAQDGLIASLDTGGSPRWAHPLGGGSPDRGVPFDDLHGVAVDAAGNVYAAGQFVGTAALGTCCQASDGEEDAFVVSYTSTGVHRWTWTEGAHDRDVATAVVAGPDGHIYVTGAFTDSISIGDERLDAHGHDDGFVASFDADGAPRWARRFGGPSTVERPWSENRGSMLAIGAEGELYLAGVVTGTATFGDEVASGPGAADVLLARLDRSGGVEWVRVLGSEAKDWSYDLASVPGGGAAVAGTMDGAHTAGDDDTTGFVARFDASGTRQWTWRIDGPGSDHIGSIAADGGDLWVGGSFENTVRVAGRTLRSAGSHDLFLGRLDADGSVLSARRFGDREPDYGIEGIALDASGRLYIAGSYQGRLDLGVTLPEATGRTDGFVARVCRGEGPGP